MLELDVYDQKILEALLRNSREQVSTIGKKIRLRRENVNYRIERMIKSGLVTGFNTLFNEKALGLDRYVVFLELSNIDGTKEEEILAYLTKNKHVCWIGPATGKWSIIFDLIIAKDIQVGKVLHEILNKFENFVEDYSLLRIEEGEYFGFKFLGLLEKKKQLPKIDDMEVDAKDRQILSHLNEDSRTTLVDISENIGLTPNAVHNRIRRLEKDGIILGYNVSIDWKKLGYEWYGLQLKLTGFGGDVNRKLSDFFVKDKRIIFYNRYIGAGWDYDIGVIVKNSVELRKFINEFRKEFSSLAKISDVFMPLEEITGYKMPRGVFT